MKTRCRLYNIYVDVLIRVQDAIDPNFKETRRLDFVSGVMESVLQEGKHDKSNHPYLANSFHLPQFSEEECLENNLIGRRMFLKGIRQGTVTDMGLDEDSVVADSMFAGMKMCGMMAERFLVAPYNTPFIVTVTPIVMTPSGSLEGLPGIILCDRLEEKKK